MCVCVALGRGIGKRTDGGREKESLEKGGGRHKESLENGRGRDVYGIPRRDLSGRMCAGVQAIVGITGPMEAMMVATVAPIAAGAAPAGTEPSGSVMALIMKRSAAVAPTSTANA